MKKTVIFIFLISIAGNAISQCTVNPALTNPGAYPSTLPSGCIGVSYSQVVDLVFSPDTLLTVPGFGSFTVPFDSIIIEVTDLPSGLGSVCMNANCTMYNTPGNPFKGCIHVSGVPLAATLSGYIFNVGIEKWLTLLGSPNVLTDTVEIELVINALPNTSVTDNSGTLMANSGTGTFRWLDCNNSFTPVSGASNAVFTPVVSGDYAVEVTDNSCVDTSGCFNVGVVSVEKKNTATFSIYPNPGNGTFHIPVLSNDYKLVDAVITDVTGKIVWTKTIDGSQAGKINPGLLENGVYYVVFTAQDNSLKLHSRIIVQ